MNNRDDNSARRDGNNQEIGKKLYEQDKNQGQQKYGYRGSGIRDQEWGEDTYFHTGPSKRGAQDREQLSRNYQAGGNRNTSYNQGQHVNLSDHYGSRANSSYRNERNYLNHGDSYNAGNYQQQGNIGGSAPGNYNEPKKFRDEMWREHPGGPSRFKEDDYRYGSGSHNWYRESRYSPDEDRNAQDQRGFFERMGSGIRDTWNDIMHADDPGYQRNHPDTQRQSERISSRERHGSEQYRDRGYDNSYDRSRDRGFEGGPRWADETDSGEDNYYNDTDRNQRYRR